MEKVLNEFVMYVLKNYSHVKGGYRHRGDFFGDDKPIKLEAVMREFLKK